MNHESSEYKSLKVFKYLPYGKAQIFIQLGRLSKHEASQSQRDSLEILMGFDKEIRHPDADIYVPGISHDERKRSS